ncbi:Glutamyl-prolyl-tRNA synthetase [Carabus blaptoides fortunei]
MKLNCDKSKPPLGGIFTAEYLKQKHKLEIEWSTVTVLVNEQTKISCSTSNDLCRTLAKNFAESELYGEDPLEKTLVDHWLSFSIANFSKQDFSKSITHLNQSLGPVTYLVAKRLTIADFAVFAALYVSKEWQTLLAKNNAPNHILRWYNFIASQKAVVDTLASMPQEVKASLTQANSRQSVEKSVTGPRNQEGKFVDLPGAEMGKVIVRFPPEASGYLHIGHAKAALLNQYYQQAFKGKLIMRFDDTNPAKENVHFEQVILEDLEMLEIKPDLFTHTSNYFDLMLEYCETMLKEGKAYVDDTEPELMKQQREQKIECENRKNSVEKNFALWEQMKQGTAAGQKCCVRAKIDMQSPNGCMRDPTIYRCKNEIHPRTGDKYKVYPTYDFACPIVDAIENVTHTLRTMEYHDRDAQFYWFIEALGLRRPHIWEYSRLSMTNTVLSKRKLTWFVQEKLVDGWDDPRFPTVRGVLRRGMTVEGLKQFIIAQGSSRSVVFMEWDKIWAFNKKVIDPIAPRYTALEYDSPVPVLVKGVTLEPLTVPKHPKNAEVGNKIVWVGPRVLIDAADAETLKEGENTTFINWGNLLIKKINRENGKVTSVEAEPNLDNKDYKKTLKLTWLCDTDQGKFTPCYCVYFEHIINKAVLAKDEDFKKYIGHETRTEMRMLGDPELRNCKKGDIIQLQRRGFFKVDVAYGEANDTCFKERPVILFSIPDGHTKESPTAGAPKQTSTSSKQPAKTTNERTASIVNAEIVKQGDQVRNLKTQKAAKTGIDTAVKVLLQLKTEFKSLTGSDWKPGCFVEPANTPTAAGEPAPSNAGDICAKIKAQGDKVRDLKTQKADKATVDSEVKALLALKVEYKQLTGQDWTANATAPVPTTNTPSPALVQSLGDDISAKVKAQGDKVRDLKAQKADKATVNAAVKTLLSLKVDYKEATGTDWTPNVAPAVVNNASPALDETAVLEKIAAQGDKVRELKSQKAEKAVLDAEVKTLLSLKAEYKTLTGKDWKPGTTASVAQPAVQSPQPVVQPPQPVVQPQLPAAASSGATAEAEVLNKITEQGDKIRKLKSTKAEKSAVESEVKLLLALKAEYKTLTGKDWKPGTVAQPAAIMTEPVTLVIENNSTKDTLTAKINEQGNTVRNLKSAGAPKGDVDAAVKVLLDLKAEYKSLTGTDFPVAGRTPSKPKEQKAPVVKSVPNKKAPIKEKKTLDMQDDGGPKKQTRLGLEARKEESLPEWYSQVITKGEMIEYYDVSGCYIYRPWSYAIWELIKDWFDEEIKKLGVQNCYFPIFVSRSVLEKEKTHIADFAPEVAWVTKSGDSDMAEPIAVRPTSETVMYPAYAKWIQSYRDLPIKLNQWNNVVRWEFKHPQPFLRTREFLWQEGHTAFATKDEADTEVETILNLYAKIYTDLLAIPVVKGRKTEKEKFAGGDYTLTVEAYISASGRAIQGATSHHLGQNFSKMFDITYEDPDTQEKKHVFQNSWGITTRTIGVMIMIHADNQGLVLPPQVASVQIVLVPCGITVSLSDTDKNALQESCDSLEVDLKAVGIRVKGDYRNNYSPGWKFNHWELKGVPIRIELGPKDLKNKQLVAVRRDTGDKITMKRENAVAELKDLLETIQKNLYDKALCELKQHMVQLNDWSKFGPNLDNKNIILAPFCGEESCEDKIKADSAREDVETEPGAPAMGAKSLCIPLEQPADMKSTDKCIHPSCQRKPKFYALFGRSY